MGKKNISSPSIEERLIKLEGAVFGNNSSLPRPSLIDTNDTISIVQKTVGTVCNVSVESITKKNFRGAEVVSNARMLSMDLCRKYDLAGTRHIASRHGRQDHTSVIHARKASEDMRELGGKFKKQYDECIRILNIQLKSFLNQEPEYYI